LGFGEWAALIVGCAAVVVAMPAIPREAKHRKRYVASGVVLLVIAAVTGVLSEVWKPSPSDVAHNAAGPSPAAPTAPTTATPPVARSSAPSSTSTTTGPQPTCPGLSVEDSALDTIYLDLDQCTSSTKGSLDADVFFNFDRIFFGPNSARTHTIWPDAVTYVVKDGQASYSGCARGRAIQDVVFIDQLAPDETVCIKTSQGHWAALKFPPAGELSGPWTYDETLFTSP
jgi:hypothetical protein